MPALIVLMLQLRPGVARSIYIYIYLKISLTLGKLLNISEPVCTSAKWADTSYPPCRAVRSPPQGKQEHATQGKESVSWGGGGEVQGDKVLPWR